MGEVSHQESAITISGLLPGTGYTIRVVAINQANFSTASDPIRLQTIPCGDQEPGRAGKRKRPNHASHPSTHPAAVSNPIITPFRPSDTVVPPIAVPIPKEASSATSLVRRNKGARSQNHASDASQRSSTGPEQNERQALEALNAKLEALRAQLKEQDTLDDEEDVEFEKLQAELIAERDELRRKLKDRDEQTKELNKSVKSLEHAQSAAERKRQHQQRALDEKLREREKMHEDMARWDGELGGLEAEAQALLQQNQDISEETQRKVEEIKAEQKPDLEALVTIEERIQEKGKEVLKLDAEKKRLEDDSEVAENADRNQGMEAESYAWNERIASLQSQLHEANIGLIQARTTYQQMFQQLELLGIGRRGSLTNIYAHPYVSHGHEMDTAGGEPSPVLPAGRVNFELPEQRPSQTSIHHRNGTNSGSTAPFRTSSPFMSHTAATVPPRYPHVSTSAALDSDALTGGALTSPSAAILLPSDLLGEDDVEDDMVKPRLRAQSNGHSGSSSSRPASIRSRPLSTNLGQNFNLIGNEADVLPGLGALPGLGGSDSLHSPDSPAPSFGSNNSPSAISSPNSNYAFPRQHKASDPNLRGIESDRRSVRSASGSSRAAPAPRSWFSLNRQRGKTTSDDGPQLGTLKYGQSQSMPRDSETPISSSRSLLSQVMGRRAPVDRFGSAFGSGLSDFGPIGSSYRPSSSRPASTYSTESSVLPKPSASFAPFGWGVSKEHLPRSNSRQSGALWSQSPWDSRRPSVQEGSSGRLANELDSVDDDDDDEVLHDGGEGTAPVPIGSRPAKDKESGSTQLNPAARDFTSVFGFGKKNDRGEKATSKSKKKDKALIDDTLGPDLAEDSSPPNSRKSRDTHPSSLADSFEYLADENEQSHGTLLQENSAVPSPGSRNSLMRRITRKGSSSKFSLPGLKEKGSLFSRKSTNVPEQSDEDGSPSLGRSVESITSGPTPTSTPDKRSSTFSLSSFTKRKPKKTNETPSISEVSMSETGDEDDGPVPPDGSLHKVESAA